MINSIHWRTVQDLSINLAEKTPGFTDAGAMSLTFRQYPTPDQDPTKGPYDVFVRGLYGGTRAGASCILEMTLQDRLLYPKKTILHPGSYSRTDQALPLHGLEDQTILPPESNFIEPGVFGLAVVEALKDTGSPTGYSTNLIYVNPETGYQELILTSEMTRELGLHQYTLVEMVKEITIPHYDQRGILSFYLEVRADHRSRIVEAKVKDGRIDSLATAIELDTDPWNVGWAGNSFSTAFHPVRLTEEVRLLVLNGRAQNDVWSIGPALLDNVGTVYWVSPEPWLTAPEGVEWHENGQRIYYCSDGFLGANGTLWMVYHESDDRIRITQGSLIF